MQAPAHVPQHAGEERHHRTRHARHLDQLAQEDEQWHRQQRSEEHTSELQSPCNLVCRLLLEKKKSNINDQTKIITLYKFHHTLHLRLLQDVSSTRYLAR